MTVRHLTGEQSRPDAVGLAIYAGIEDEQTNACVALQVNASGFTNSREDASGQPVPLGSGDDEAYSALVGPGWQPLPWLQLHATAGVGWDRRCLDYDDGNPQGTSFEVCRNDSVEFAWGAGVVVSWPERQGAALEVGYDDFFGGLVLGIGFRF